MRVIYLLLLLLTLQTATSQSYEKLAALYEILNKVEHNKTFKKKEMVRLSVLYKDFPYRITAKNMKNPILYKVEFTEEVLRKYDYETLTKIVNYIK
jgi:hypothetical protein